MSSREADSEFQPVRVRRPREQVELQIRSAILGGEFQTGDRLPSEAALARDFGVSRSTIREALRSLAEAGLISTFPGASGGSFVEGIDHHALSTRFGDTVETIMRFGTLNFEEVAGVRLMLEVPSARLAAHNRTDAHLEELEQIVDSEKTIAFSDPEVGELNAAFHRTIAEASGNRLLTALISALHGVTHPLTYIDTSPELSRQSVIHHIRIVRSVREQDEDSAAGAMKDHLTYLSDGAIAHRANETVTNGAVNSGKQAG
ncbi:MAG: FadR family transcriptional regulator [Actinobacteria bacterium]|nr:FadR family transcriptional regulator [Actinomycetota bacterium]